MFKQDRQPDTHEQEDVEGTQVRTQRAPGEFEVGYARPPRSTQFRPGQSGNPRGRPKGAKNLATLTREKLDAKVVVREGGRERRMSKAELGITKMVNSFAETGDLKAFQTLMRLHTEGAIGEVTPPAKPALAEADTHPSDDAIIDFFRKQLLTGNGGSE